MRPGQLRHNTSPQHWGGEEQPSRPLLRRRSTIYRRSPRSIVNGEVANGAVRDGCMSWLGLSSLDQQFLSSRLFYEICSMRIGVPLLPTSRRPSLASSFPSFLLWTLPSHSAVFQPPSAIAVHKQSSPPPRAVHNFSLNRHHTKHRPGRYVTRAGILSNPPVVGKTFICQFSRSILLRG